MGFNKRRENVYDYGKISSSAFFTNQWPRLRYQFLSYHYSMFGKQVSIELKGLRAVFRFLPKLLCSQNSRHVRRSSVSL